MLSHMLRKSSNAIIKEPSLDSSLITSYSSFHFYYKTIFISLMFLINSGELSDQAPFHSIGLSLPQGFLIRTSFWLDISNISSKPYACPANSPINSSSQYTFPSPLWLGDYSMEHPSMDPFCISFSSLLKNISFGPFMFSS